VRAPRALENGFVGTMATSGDTTPVSIIQASRLVRRFNLSCAVAAATAALFYGEGRE
jgi:hypothetical protein